MFMSVLVCCGSGLYTRGVSSSFVAIGILSWRSETLSRCRIFASGFWGFQRRATVNEWAHEGVVTRHAEYGKLVDGWWLGCVNWVPECLTSDSLPSVTQPAIRSFVCLARECVTLSLFTPHQWRLLYVCVCVLLVEYQVLPSSVWLQDGGILSHCVPRAWPGLG